MTEPRTIEQHGSRIIAALEHAWAAIQDQHPDVPDVVIVTGAGSNQKGTPEGYRLRGHHWPERWVLDGQDRPRAPELFIAGRAAVGRGPCGRGGHAARGAHALATQRGIKDTSAAGNRYHNKRFVALAAELGLRGPDVPDKITGWSDCTLTGRPPTTPMPTWPPGSTRPGSRSWPTWPARAAPAAVEGGGEDQGDDGTGTPAKRGGRRVPVECACQPEPRRIQLTPKQIEDGPIICGLCCAPFEPPDDDAEPEDDR